MQGRFGVKDFVLFIAVLALGVLTLLAMLQNDRVWDELRAMRGVVAEQKAMVARLERKLESGQFSTASPNATPGSPSRDESWARQGFTIAWPPARVLPNDPRQNADYAEGGTFTEIFEGQPPKFTPFVYTDVYGGRIIEDLVCEMLASYDPKTLELRAWLAEAWQYDPKGMWLRVKIRDRACFSDGSPVTAEDVRWTFQEYIFNPEIEAERFRSTMRVIDHVEVISDKVVEFHFREPRFNNLGEALRMVILPKHFYSQFTPSQINQSTALLMGSGPYKIAQLDPDNQWKPGQDFVLVRNDNYWGPRFPLDQHRFTVIADNVARLTAFQNGRGDMMRGTPEQYRVMSEQDEFLKKNQALSWTNMRSGYSYIAWNCGLRNGKPTPFVDKRVRHAMSSLIDVARVNRDFLDGLGTPATGPFNPMTAQADTTIPPWTYDPDHAAKLLDEAGWIDRNNDGIRENEQGEPFVFQFTTYSGSTSGQKLGNYLRDQCARIGVVCNVEIQDWSIGDSRRKSRDYDAITLAWSWTKPENDPTQLWHSNSIKNQGDNFVQWSNPEADRLIEEGIREIDESRRNEIWHKLHRVIYDDQPYTFISNSPWIRFISKRVSNAHPYTVGLEKWEMYIPSVALPTMPQ